MDHASGARRAPPSPSPSPSPPPPDAGKRQRRPNVRLAGSIPPPSHLPHPRRIPIIPASRPRIRTPLPLPLPHHHNPSATAQNPAKPPSPGTSGDIDDLVLAAAFPRKPRTLVAEEEDEVDEEAGAAGEVVDVADWLWGMGMGRYLPAFEAHEVDGEVLPCLTMDDLRDMGIGAVGARRKLFCAIQRLRPPPPRR